MTDVHADNIGNLVIGLKVWQLFVDDVCAQKYVKSSLEATFASLTLANLTFSLEVDGLTAVVLKQWPTDLKDRMRFIAADLKKIESALKKLSDLLSCPEDAQSSTLKAKIEHLLK